MTLIEHIELDAGSSASILFDSIASDFTDLALYYSLRDTTDVDYFGLKINGSTSNFTQRYLRGEGTSVSSGTRSDNLFVTSIVKSSFTASTHSNCVFYFPKYTSSNDKSFSLETSLENNATDGRNMILAGLWGQTSVISSLELVATSNFAQYGSATLFGVTSGSDGTTTVS
jgi:hypothetical protein